MVIDDWMLRFSQPLYEIMHRVVQLDHLSDSLVKLTTEFFKEFKENGHNIQLATECIDQYGRKIAKLDSPEIKGIQSNLGKTKRLVLIGAAAAASVTAAVALAEWWIKAHQKIGAEHIVDLLKVAAPWYTIRSQLFSTPSL